LKRRRVEELKRGTPLRGTSFNLISSQRHDTKRAIQRAERNPLQPL